MIKLYSVLTILLLMITTTFFYGHEYNRIAPADFNQNIASNKAETATIDAYLIDVNSNSNFSSQSINYNSYDSDTDTFEIMRGIDQTDIYYENDGGYKSHIGKVSPNTSNQSTSTINNSRELNVETENIKVYPNPVVKQLFINSGGNINIKSVQVVDLLGTILISKDVNNYKTEINISDIPKGVYLIQVHLDLGNKTITKRIIKK